VTGADSTATEWEGRALGYWQHRLDVPALILLESTGSTNDIAARRAQDGAPAGLLVLADHQSAGRGQHGRSWHAAPGTSLLFSMLLRPAGGTAPGVIPIRVGTALTRALRAATGLDVRLKWPNDLLLGGGKLGGVLCEAAGAGSSSGYVVAGVGINVRPQEHDWAGARPASVASLDEAAAAPHDRGLLLAAVVHAIQPLTVAPAEPLSGAELDALADIDALRGRSVVVDNEAPTYIAAGVAADGALLLQRGSAVRRVVSGTVRIRAPASHGPRQAP
jgi:BirA family transcriptional regulator, biotin operon repressor / biotin---[acetyl-CoA-carboxylase] ligase